MRVPLFSKDRSVGSSYIVDSTITVIARDVVIVNLPKKLTFRMNRFSRVTTIAAFVNRMVWFVAPIDLSVVLPGVRFVTIVRWKWPRTNKVQLTLIFRLTTVVRAGVKAVMAKKSVANAIKDKFVFRLNMVAMTGRLVVIVDLNVTSRTTTVIRTLTVLLSGGLRLVKVRIRLPVLTVMLPALPVVLMLLTTADVALEGILRLLNMTAEQVIPLLPSTGEAVIVVVVPVPLTPVRTLGGGRGVPGLGPGRLG